jgi:hypothetical protein
MMRWSAGPNSYYEINFIIISTIATLKMLKSIRFIPFALGFIIVTSIIVCKYFNSPKIFLIIVILASAYYQKDSNRKNGEKDNFEDTLINVSRFIIFSGIFGYVAVRIIGLFVNGFD